MKELYKAHKQEMAELLDDHGGCKLLVLEEQGCWDVELLCTRCRQKFVQILVENPFAD